MRILFVHQGIQTFVETDLKILRENYIVRSFYFPPAGIDMYQSIKCLPGLIRGIQWCDISFAWFGSLNAFFAVFLSKIFNKKSIVVLSGGEVCEVICNGHHISIATHPLKKWFPIITCKLADKLLLVSEFTKREALKNLNANPIKTKVIHHGFDYGFFQRNRSIDQQPTVATVCIVWWENYWKKRLDLFIDAARLLPNIPFYIVGPEVDDLGDFIRDKAPPNLVLTGAFYGKDLMEFLSQVKVYVQVSEVESFACSLAEAMLCECIPVVANRTAMPEVVGNAGYYIESFTAEELSEAIHMALNDKEMGVKARERIIRNFPLEKRCQKILNVLEDLSYSSTHKKQSRRDFTGAR